MSKLFLETDHVLVLEDYIHGDKDEYSPWEVDATGNEKYSGEVHDAEHYALSEFKIKYMINKETGEVTYLEFDGVELPT